MYRKGRNFNCDPNSSSVSLRRLHYTMHVRPVGIAFFFFFFRSGDSYPGGQPVEILTNDLNFPVSFHFYSAPKCCHALWGTQMITHFTSRGLYYVSDADIRQFQRNGDGTYVPA